MVSMRNRKLWQEKQAPKVPHYRLCKLSIGVVSVLLGTTILFIPAVHADASTADPAVLATNVASPQSATPVVPAPASNPASQQSNVEQVPSVEVPANQNAEDNQQQMEHRDPASVSLDNGVTLSLDHDSLDFDHTDHQQTTLHFTVDQVVNAGDTYLIKLPVNSGLDYAAMHVPGLPNDIGTTTTGYQKYRDQTYYFIKNVFNVTGKVQVDQQIKLQCVNQNAREQIIENNASYTKIIDQLVFEKLGGNHQFLSLNVYLPPVQIRTGSVQLTIPEFIENNSSFASYSGTVRLNYERQMKLLQQLSFDFSGFKYFHLTELKVLVDNFNQSQVFDAIFDSDQKCHLTHDQLSRFNYPGTYFTLNFKGYFQIPDSLFKDHKYTLKSPTLTTDLEDINGYRAQQQIYVLGRHVVVDDIANLSPQELFQYYTIYSANYINKSNNSLIHSKDKSTIVIPGHTNWDYIPGFTLQNRTDMQFDDFEYTLNIPDGFIVHEANVELSHGFAAGDRIEIVADNGEVKTYQGPNINANVGVGGRPIRQIKFHVTLHGSQQIAVRFSTTYNNGKKNIFAAKNYADGRPVQANDILNFNASFQSPKIHPTETTQMVMRLMEAPYTWTGDAQIIKQQTNVAPESQDAGYLSYLITPAFDTYYDAILHQPIVYLKVPDNATLASMSQIKVTNQLNGQAVTPQDMTVSNVDGHRFIRIDLSNFEEICPAIYVYYGNHDDVLSSTEDSAMVVWAKNVGSDFGSRCKVNDQNKAALTEFQPLLDHDGVSVDQLLFTKLADAWTVKVVDSLAIQTGVQGNQDHHAVSHSQVDVHSDGADHFKLYSTLINASSQDLDESAAVVNLPNPGDGHSQFAVHITGPVTLVNPRTNEDWSQKAQIYYSTSLVDLDQLGPDSLPGQLLTADQVNDWAQIKSIIIKFSGDAKLPQSTVLRLEMPGEDDDLYDHVNQSAFLSSAFFSLQPNSTMEPVVIKAGGRGSAQLTMHGQSTIKTAIHYVDRNGQEHLVLLPSRDVTYQEGQDTMKRSDFITADGDLTVDEKALLPAGIVIDFDHPSIKNSSSRYLHDYANKVASFDQVVMPYFDQDTVVFEGRIGERVQDSVVVTEVIHYVLSDGQLGPADVVRTITLHRNGWRDYATGQVSWDDDATPAEFAAVHSPVVEGYTANRSQVPAIVVTLGAVNNGLDDEEATSVTVSADAVTPTIVRTVYYQKQAPDKPDIPDQPDQPDIPDKPNEPDQPDVPDKPDVPDEPEQLAQPARPDNENRPLEEAITGQALADRKHAARQLPQTGSQPNHATVWTSLLLIVEFLLGLGSRHKHE